MLSLDNRNQVYLNGQPIELTNLEHRLVVRFLTAQIGANISRDDIIDHVWGIDAGQYTSPATLEKLVARLRARLKDMTGFQDCPFIKAGMVGHYKMVWPEEWEVPSEATVTREDEAELLALYRQLSDEQQKIFLVTAKGLLAAL